MATAGVSESEHASGKSLVTAMAVVVMHAVGICESKHASQYQDIAIPCYYRHQ